MEKKGATLTFIFFPDLGKNVCFLYWNVKQIRINLSVASILCHARVSAAVLVSATASSISEVACETCKYQRSSAGRCLASTLTLIMS